VRKGRVVILSGERGIGKSRLLRALRDLYSSESLTPLSYLCAPTFRDSAPYPFIAQLSSAADIERSLVRWPRRNPPPALLARHP
jgi:Mg-chelatase subunit ChlI